MKPRNKAGNKGATPLARERAHDAREVEQSQKQDAGGAWSIHAGQSRKRAAIVRKVAGMMRGTEPLPDGLTRASLVVCGTAWRGFDWTRRGVEVSPAVWESERNAATAALVSRSVEVAREAGKVSDAFHAADALAALRGESLTPPAEWTSPALERLRPIRDAVAGCLDALNEEGEAWRDFEAAYLEAREAVPVEEIEAARARLAAEDAAATAPLRVAVSGPVEVEGVRVEAVREVGAKVEDKGGGKKPPAAKSKGRKRYNISQKEAANKLGKNVRTLQRYEANPGCVPDEMRGYCRAVRESWSTFNTWLYGLGNHEGMQSDLRAAGEKLGRDFRGMRFGRRP